MNIVNDEFDTAGQRVACIGLGTVGRSWATLFAARGLDVDVFDPSSEQLQRSLAAIHASLRDLQDAALVDSADEAHARVHPAASLSSAVASAAYVQESAPENLAIKQALFGEIDSAAPDDAILASSTSEIPGSKLFSTLPGRHRCLVAHPLNPPHVIPLVELGPAPTTSPETVSRATAFFKALGQRPILVRRELSGFIANRLQLAVLAEALHLVGEGYCSAEDIDVAMQAGLARRWAVVGPFETGHLNADGGYAAYIRAYGETHRRIISDLKIDYPWGDELVRRIDAELSRVTPADRTLERQAWRDRRILALASLLDESGGNGA